MPKLLVIEKQHFSMSYLCPVLEFALEVREQKM